MCDLSDPVQGKGQPATGESDSNFFVVAKLANLPSSIIALFVKEESIMARACYVVIHR